MANNLRETMAAQLDQYVTQYEEPTDSLDMADAALSVIRKWLESEAQVEPVARALGTLAGAKFDVFSELTGLPYDDWLAWSSEARAALKSLSKSLEGTGE